MLNFQRNYMANRILDAFFRNWLVFLITLLGVSGVVGAVLMVRSVKYTATAAIRLGSAETEFIKQAATGSSSGSMWTTPAQVQAARFTDLMRATLPGQFVDRALKAAKLKNPINIDPSANDERFNELKNSVYVLPLSRDVIQIGLAWKDRSECAKIVEGLQSEFIKQAGIDNTTTAAAAIAFMDTQIEEYRKRLQSTESALTDYKRTHNNLMPDAQTALIEQYSSLNMQRDGQVISANDARLKIEALKKRLKEIKPVIVGVRILNQGASPEEQALATLQAQRNDLLKKSWRPDSNIIRELDGHIKRFEDKIEDRRRRDPNRQRDEVERQEVNNPEYADIQQQLVVADIAQKTQAAQIAALDRRLGELKATIASMPEGERRLVEKTRDYTIVKDQFEELLKRREGARVKASVGEVTAMSQFIKLNAVYAESTATTKKKAMTIGGSLLVGVVVGFLLILVREWMDPSVRYETDAVRILDMPVLASLPESGYLRFPVSGRSGAFKRLPGGTAPALKDRA